MKVLTLEIGEKRYHTGKITALMSREALNINKEAIKLAKKAKELEGKEGVTEDEILEMADQLLEQTAELKDKEEWLICEIYGKQFTVDELEKNLSDEEIEDQIKQITAGVTGIVTKN